LLARAWHEVKEFSGLGREATYLWPRWLVLRAVGFVFILVFAGIIEEGQAIVGPAGIAQLDEFFAQLHQLFPSRLDAFLHAPSLFWLNTGAAMITALSWLGLAAAVALTCNLWPRFALGACWLIFLSFITTWRAFSPAQLDKLMLEVALICLPFAPAGFRPGLGVKTPPRPIAVFMIRWLLFRIMLESGFVKVFSGDPHWRNFTAMEVMYETGPFPTLWGYLDHHLPHTYHLFEIALTYIAEFAAPLLAVFAGRRGRWFALGAWTLFQAGIQLTNNFGWLNTASIGLGLLLLDDQMIRDAVTKLRLHRLAAFLSARAQSLPPPPLAPWRLNALRAGLWLHFGFTLIFFVKSCGVPLTAMPAVFAWPAQRINSFYSANAYSLYATFEPVRFQVEFEGSNDGGATWRPYLYRYIPQRVDEISPHIAPWFARFDATLQIEAWNGRKSPLYSAVAGHLLARNPAVMARFRADPFADRPATQIRIRGYELVFTDLATQRATGHYWKKTLRGEYLPMMTLDSSGRIAEVSLDEGNAALRAGNLPAAFAFFEQHYRRGVLAAGFRVADMLTRGGGVRPDPARAFAIYTALAREGELGAEHYLGLCYEFGLGVAPDPAQAAIRYRAALDRGYVQSAFSLGALLAADKLPQRQDIDALAWLTEAVELAQGDDPYSQFVRDRQPALAQRLISRMTAGDIAKARQQAADRLRPSGPVQPPVH
jgi:TPR repeat protein